MKNNSKIKALYNKHKEVILYLIFGGLTTVLNYIVYFIFVSFGIHYEISNCIAWVAGVTFAYLTNRSIVFESQAEGAKKKIIEAVEFVLARVFSLLAEMLLLYLFIDIITLHPDKQWNELIAKLIGAVVVVILNYIASKFVIFTKKKDKDADSPKTE